MGYCAHLTTGAERHDAASASGGRPDNRTGTSGNAHTGLTRASNNSLTNCGCPLNRALNGRCLAIERDEIAIVMRQVEGTNAWHPPPIILKGEARPLGGKVRAFSGVAVERKFVGVLAGLETGVRRSRNKRSAKEYVPFCATGPCGASSLVDALLMLFF